MRSMKASIAAATVCAIVLALGGPVRAQSRSVRTPVTSPPGQVAGRVVRPDGLPQPDAQVVLAQRGPAGALRQLPWRARTAFDGRYEIAGVPPGRYLVLVRAIGADAAAEGRPDATLFPGVPTSEPGALVDVLPGLSAEGIDVWLVPGPRRFSVSGRVFRAGGTTFDSLAIEMGRPGARATDVWTADDAAGLFTIDPAPPGPLVLRARAVVDGRVLTGVVTTTVVVGPVEDVRITLQDLLDVAGRIRATGGRGLPAGLSVSLVPRVLSPSALYPVAEAVVDPAGGFRTQAERGEHAIVVGGLPAGWGVVSAAGVRRSGDPAVLLSAAAAALQIEIGPTAGR
jgi:hypothetical protein